MPLFRRPEGARVTDASPMRQMMPFLIKGRNEAAVTFTLAVDVTEALDLAHQTPGISLFHLVLAAHVRTLALRPRLNRFIAGQRLYQRHHIDLAFVVKKRLHDDADMTAVKVRFQPRDTALDVARRADAAITTGRGDAPTTSERELRLITRLPRPLIQLTVALQRALDHHNLLPAALIEPDPLYSSIFLANLGSVGIDAPFHHLFEYGTTPLFATLGRVHPHTTLLPDGSPQTRQRAHLRYTFDERIEDGFYAARSLDLLQHLIEHPRDLLLPPDLP